MWTWLKGLFTKSGSAATEGGAQVSGSGSASAPFTGRIIATLPPIQAPVSIDPPKPGERPVEVPFVRGPR